MTNVSKKKRVVHFVITDDFSGAESVAAHIIKDMPSDWEAYYVAPMGEGCRIASEMGLETISCNTSDLKELKRVVKELRPDAVHAHDCRMSFLCALSGFSFTSHLHANWSWMKKFSPKSLLLAYSCKKADKVICVSESIKNDYIFRSWVKDKMIVLENTVNSENIIEKSREENEGEYDLCFVGRLTAVKEPKKFLHFIDGLKVKKPDIKAVIVGDGELKEELLSLVTQLGLEDNVVFAGFQRNPYKFMKSSKVLVMTSSVEGFGLVAVEAMILGLPVVAFPVGGLLNIVSSESGCLAENVEMMRCEILKLLTNKEYYEKKSEGAISASKKYTDRNKYISDIIKIYEHR